jgi:hypothetical protein
LQNRAPRCVVLAACSVFALHLPCLTPPESCPAVYPTSCPAVVPCMVCADIPLCPQRRSESA